MDVILPQLLAFPPHPPPTTPLADGDYDRQIKGLVQTLSKVPASKLTSGVPGGGDLLDILDPSINTLPYLYVLLAHIKDSDGREKNSHLRGMSKNLEQFIPGTAIWQKAVKFMDHFDPVQIRYAGHEIRHLIEVMDLKANRCSQPQAAISPIRSAILRIDPTASTFTSSHFIFVRTCLAAREFTAALPVLDQAIYYVPASTNKAAEDSLYPYLCSSHESSSTFIVPNTGISAKITYHEYLQYFLYGAMCYMGLKDWKNALYFLETVLVAPVATNASRIQVEAYKKWILVGLLYRGNTISMPKTANSQAVKQYRALSRAYEGLADVFCKSLRKQESDLKLQDEALAGRQIWKNDSNTGLVRQVITAFRVFSILQLQRTFAALTIAVITRRTSPDPNNYAETGTFILHLINSERLRATISKSSPNPKDWIVRFSDETNGPVTQSEERQYNALVQRTQKIKNLTLHIRETDRKLSLNKDYLKGQKHRKDKEGVGEGDTNWAAISEGFDHDEDMMADL